MARVIRSGVAALVTAVGLSALGTGPVNALPEESAPAPDYELPFACGEEWVGSTRSSHRPSPRNIDFNRPGDLGAALVSSAPGYVARVADTGSTSYGRWVQVDHGNGHATLYAHLKAAWVVPGQYVDQGSALGLVGASGGVSGAHLHYEQKLGRTYPAPVFHQEAYVHDRPVVSQNCPDLPLAGDFDGDGRADVAVFRRTAGSGTFELAGAGGAVTPISFGRGTDTPLVGDWDGDGRDEVGVRRPRARAFHLRGSDGSVRRQRMGRISDLPVVGDWDGDGADEIGVWRPANGLFLLRNADGTVLSAQLGNSGSQPLAGDWDGDGDDDLGVFDAAVATFTLRVPATADSANGTAESYTRVAYGTATDLPVVGDWNGDRRDDVGVWSPSSAVWTLRTPRPRRPARARSRQLVFGQPR